MTTYSVVDNSEEISKLNELVTELTTLAMEMAATLESCNEKESSDQTSELLEKWESTFQKTPLYWKSNIKDDGVELACFK